MSLCVLTDHAAIRRVLDGFIAADPVRGTVLGTIGASLRDGAWAASDGDQLLAVRSDAAYPVAVVGEWLPAERDELRGLLAALPHLHALSGQPGVINQLVAALDGTRVASTMGQGLYRLDELLEPAPVPGYADRAREADRALANEWFRAFLADVGETPRPGETMIDEAVDAGRYWLWRESSGAPVSMACRRPVIGGSARVGPVYTPPEHRGHGYGSAVTAAATRQILAEGGIPVLFTDLANATSNKIYQQLGYNFLEERVVVTFS